MDYMQLSIEDREKLKNCIRQEFIFFVKPSNVLPYISKYNCDVLTPADKSKLLAITNTKGDHDGAIQLLEDLSRYKGWLKCFMDVLRDPQVKLGHAAEIMENRIVDAQLGHVLHLDSGVKSVDDRGLGGLQNTFPKDVHSDEHLNLLDGAVANVPDNCAQSGETSTMTTALDLLLIGKTGMGKSATGNSILGRQAFKTSCGPSSETKSFCCEYTEINGRPIKVVDGISMFDTDLMEDSNFKFAINSLQEAIAINPEGYHAFCIVIRFGCRFTQEDQQTIHLLKGVFGEEFVKNFCILLMTHGENFDLENEDESGLSDFTDWYCQLRGVFKHLVDECNGRLILFRNKTRNPAVKNDQRDRLIKMIDDMCVQRLRYGRENYRRAQRERDCLHVESLKPGIRETTLREASLIIQHMGEIQLEDPEQHLKKLNEMQKRVDALLENVKSQDKDTGVLRDVLKNVGNIKRIVEEQMKNTTAALTIQRERERNAREMDAMRAGMEQLRLQQREEDQRMREELKAQNMMMRAQVTNALKTWHWQ